MSILSTVTTGASQAGIRMVIGGLEKMGKTTLCAEAPGVLLVPLEVGFAGVRCAKTKMIQSWQETEEFMQETLYYAQRGQFPYKTIAFDSATAAERHIHEAVIKRDPSYREGGKKTITMESAHGGYGKAYSLANAEFDDFLAQCDQLAFMGGINIIMTCHVFSSLVKDPTAGEYESWDLLLHSPKNQKTYGKRERITQWADVIGFLYEPVFIQGEGGKMQRAISQNKGRVMGVSRTPAYVAGNRFGMVGEIPMPQGAGWNTFADCLQYYSGIDVHSR